MLRVVSVGANTIKIRMLSFPALQAIVYSIR
jgi:hypothetical protein